MTRPSWVAYVETNWLVALAFPHDPSHLDADSLLQQAEKGAVEIRLPEVAWLEFAAKAVKHSNVLMQEITSLQEKMARAAAAGLGPFPSLEAFERYAQRRPVEGVQKRVDAAGVKRLKDPSAALEVQTRLNLRSTISGRDFVDLFVLSAILADCASLPPLPTTFFSLDRKMFGPGTEAARLLEERRVLCRTGFNDGDVVGAWQQRFQTTEP